MNPLNSLIKYFTMMKAAMAYLTAAGTTTNINFGND
jgi:hypothetical protein